MSRRTTSSVRADIVHLLVLSCPADGQVIVNLMRAAAEDGERGVCGVQLRDLLLNAFDAVRYGSVLRAYSLVLARL